MNHMSPDELQKIMADYTNWVNTLGENYLAGQRLQENGSLLTSKTDKITTDGPFLESKEIIAGFFIIAAKDLDEANNIAQSSPHLGPYSIEVRPIVFPKMK